MIKDSHKRRLEAIEKRELTYVGRPCKNGHKSGIRYVSNCLCCECAQFYTQKQIEKRRKGPKRKKSEQEKPVTNKYMHARWV